MPTTSFTRKLKQETNVIELPKKVEKVVEKKKKKIKIDMD